MSRARPFWSHSGNLSTTPVAIYLPNGWSQLKVVVDNASYGCLGPAYTAPSVADVNGITTLTLAGAPTSGTFSLAALAYDENEVETATINYNASAATIKTKLTDTGLFATGDITAAGGALDSAAVTLTWTGVYAVTVPPIRMRDNDLVGGSNAKVQVLTTTKPKGNGGYGYIINTEVWVADENGGKTERFLYLACQTGTSAYGVTAYS